LFLVSVYTVVICVVAAVLLLAVNRLEPNRRVASGLKIAIVAVAVAAILAYLFR
jgi:hypothetical protein